MIIDKMSLFRKLASQKIGIVAFLLSCTLILVVINSTSGEAMASSIDLASDDTLSILNVQVTDTSTSTIEIETESTGDVAVPALQSTDSTTSSVRISTNESVATQNLQSNPASQIEPTSVYSFSLVSQGYEETILDSPFANTSYQFRLPENWVVQNDGLLELDLSYIYSSVDGTIPAFLGSLTITLNEETLAVFQIDERELDHQRLQIPIPASLLFDSGRVQTIDLTLDAGFLCDIQHRATLIVHPTSFISLNYSQGTLVPDLSRYPRPFYQRSFDPDSIRFVLPSQPTPAESASALAIAAKLGDLTDQRLVISATTDLELEQLASSVVSSPIDEHFVIIGQPENNKLLPLLNEITDLPVSLHQRQLELVTQGPAVVAPGDIFTYTFTVTNTLDQVVDLSLVNSLPSFTELLECGDCADDRGQVVAWDNNQLAPDETLSLSLMLKATNVLTDIVIENTITLIDANLGPVNADTLVSTVVANSAKNELQTSVAGQEGYFFIYNGQAVVKEDGVIQEILSPWSDNRAILIITGLSDEAVHKAGQAMSSEVRFPGMSGQVALVQDALPLSEVEESASTAVEMTFEELGYEDVVINGIGGGGEAKYDFEVPFGWKLTDDASIELFSSHSQLLDYEESGLTAFINNQPVASIALDEKTAGANHLHISLADANVGTAQDNRLTIQVMMPAQNCEDQEQEAEQRWFLVKNSSKIFLDHNEVTGLSFSLSHFPYPFHANRALTDLLFALPSSPAIAEWDAALNLAASLGNSAAGKTLMPAVLMGDNLPARDLADYHIIAIGRPSRNVLIQEVNSLLPQPFVPGTDEIEQQLDDVVFRLATNVDLGYVQLISSPWDEAHAFLAVTGTTNEGVWWATDTLARRPWQLSHNLALIKGDEVNTIDTRRLTSDGMALAVVTVVPEMTPVATPIVSPTPSLIATPTPSPDGAASMASESSSDPPAWLMPVVGINGLVVLGIFATVIWQARKKRNPNL